MRRLVGVGVIALSGLGFGSLAGCGSGTSQAITAPIAALSATDVVVETNLQTVGQSGADGGGLTTIAIVSGPSLDYNEVSQATRPGVTVLASFDQLDGHCLGTIAISASTSPVLGESAPGNYDFWQLHGAASLCDAADFIAYAKAPTNWSSGDPSTSWPHT